MLFLRYGLISSPLTHEKIMKIWYFNSFLHLPPLLATWVQLNLCEPIHTLMLNPALAVRTEMDRKFFLNSIEKLRLHSLMDCDRKSGHIKTMCSDVQPLTELTCTNWSQVEVIQWLCRTKLLPLLDLQWHWRISVAEWLQGELKNNKKKNVQWINNKIF